MLTFLYSRCKWPYSVEVEVIEYVEATEGTPLSLYESFPKVWWKMLYAIAMTIEYKATGKIAFYFPNGVYRWVFDKMVDDVIVRKLEVVTPPTPMMTLRYVNGVLVSK
jgi:hypothetical protein